MIEIKNVSKSFGNFQALKNLSMTLPTGSVYGLVGPNGAGKTTLIRHVSGVCRPDAGEILLDGERIFDNPGAKEKIFCIYDDIFYYMHATTLDMMHFYKKLWPGFDTERYQRLGQVFPEVDEKAPLRTLSRGMLKQSAFRLALSCRPEILVLDEPVDGLDPVMRRQLWSILMGDVAENGTTVLLSSHNLRELEDVCDHVGILHHGELLLERSLSELQDSVSKLQVLFPEGSVNCDLGDLELLHRSSAGRMQTLIVRGDPETASEKLAAFHPIYVEAIPLTLEEIFIYELGGMDYAVSDILV